jgi:hypothetical protein
MLASCAAFVVPLAYMLAVSLFPEGRGLGGSPS